MNNIQFICPYCQENKDIWDRNFKSEIRNFKQPTDVPLTSSDIYESKHIIFNITKYKVPICDECLKAIRVARRKSILISLSIFIYVEVILFFYNDHNNDGNVWWLISRSVPVGLVCLYIWWYVRRDVLTKMRGIRDNSLDGFKTHYGVYDPFFNWKKENHYHPD